MSTRETIMTAFLADALRLSAEGRECVNQLAEQAAKKHVSPAQVGELHRIIHTLKGTATLVEGADAIVRSLHGIEGQLACQSVAESARHPNWIPVAREALEAAQEQLLRMQRRERFGAKPEPLVKGFLVRASDGGEGALFWFPLSGVSRILSPEEVGEGSALCMDGAWVPVIRSPGAGEGAGSFGLALRSIPGRAVVAVKEVIGVRAWSDASRDGAVPGMELLERRMVPAAAKRKAKVSRKAA